MTQHRTTSTAVICALFALFGVSTSALAFAPIPHREVPDLIGKSVYAANNKELAKGAWAYAGQKLTLVSAEPFGSQDDGPAYNYVKVRTSDGKEGEIQIRFLSMLPLKYDLTNVKSGRALIRAAFEDAYELPAKMHKIRMARGYGFSQRDFLDDYQKVDAMEESLNFSTGLVRGLIHGINYAPDDILRNDENKWIARADDHVLDWYSKGVENDKEKRQLDAYLNCLSTISNVSYFGYRIAEIGREKEAKRWRQDMDGIPESKLRKIEAEKLKELDTQQKEQEKRIAQAFADAAKQKKKI